MIPRNLPPIQPLRPPKELNTDLVKENARLREKLRKVNKQCKELTEKLRSKL